MRQMLLQQISKPHYLHQQTGNQVKYLTNPISYTSKPVTAYHLPRCNITQPKYKQKHVKSNGESEVVIQYIVHCIYKSAVNKSTHTTRYNKFNVTNS